MNTYALGTLNSF